MEPTQPENTVPKQARPRRRIGLPKQGKSPAPALPEFPCDARNWKAVLQALIDRNNWKRAANDAVVSNQTRQDRAAFYFYFFRTLRELGVYVDPRYLRETHVRTVAAWWVERGHAPATFQKYLSHLRTFSTWIGKPGMVRCPERYVAFPKTTRRTYVAHHDKGWASNGVDVTQLIDKIRAFDPYVGMQLLVMQTFGLRPKEAIMLRPLQNVVPADSVPAGARSDTHFERATQYLFLERGAKGGRPRWVPIDTPEKERVVALLRLAASHPGAHLSDPGRSLKENRRRFRYVLDRFGVTKSKLGITSYGLRHAFAHAEYEAIAGVPPPVKQVEGNGGASDDTTARADVARQLGHSRTRIANAYVGGTRARATDREPPEGAP